MASEHVSTLGLPLRTMLRSKVRVASPGQGLVVLAPSPTAPLLIVLTAEAMWLRVQARDAQRSCASAKVSSQYAR